MAVDGVSYFMTHYHSYACLIPAHRHDPGIKDNFTSWHAPCIYLVILNQIEFPGKAFEKPPLVVRLQILFNSRRYPFPNSYHLLSVSGIGHYFALAFHFTVLLIRQRQNLSIIYQAQLSPTTKRYRCTSIEEETCCKQY